MEGEKERGRGGRREGGEEGGREEEGRGGGSEGGREREREKKRKRERCVKRLIVFLRRRTNHLTTSDKLISSSADLKLFAYVRNPSLDENVSLLLLQTIRLTFRPNVQPVDVN